MGLLSLPKLNVNVPKSLQQGKIQFSHCQHIAIYIHKDAIKSETNKKDKKFKQELPT